MEGKFWGAWRVARSASINPGGSLTLVSGFLSIRPRPGSAIVGAANGALEALTRSLAIDLAPVRVNAVSPGIIDTPIRASMPEDARVAMLGKIAAALPSAGSVSPRTSRARFWRSWRSGLRPARLLSSMAADQLLDGAAGWHDARALARVRHGCFGARARPVLDLNL